MCENFFWKVDYFHQGWTIKIFEIYNIDFLGARINMSVCTIFNPCICWCLSLSRMIHSQVTFFTQLNSSQIKPYELTNTKVAEYDFLFNSHFF